VQDKWLRLTVRCMHCGKTKHHHRASTQDCPLGKRTRTGYAKFALTCFAEPARGGVEEKPSDDGSDPAPAGGSKLKADGLRADSHPEK
jgi:hypothetical protein